MNSLANQYLIGVDIGTQGTKTSLFDMEGSTITESFEPSNLIKPSPGVVEQEPSEIYSSVLNTIKEVMGKSGVSPCCIAAIGLDGQMAGILGIDEEWNAVTHYDSWLDTRCEKYIRLIKQEAEELVIRTTGCPVTYAHGPKILWWKAERPEIYKKISKFILPTTYVAGKMTGLKASEAFIDYTHLHFSGYGDIEKKQWSKELLSLFNIDEDKLPHIVEPWKVVGVLTKQTAGMCGLVEGIPVVAGCGDQAATSLGAGVTSAGTAFDVAGTASVFSCCVDAYKPDVRNKTLLFPRSVIPGLWIPLAYISGGGLCIRWFRDNLTGIEKQASYVDLDREAEKISAGSEGLFFVPHFGGRVCPSNPNVCGMWMGLNWAHGRAHMYRAIMEGIAYEYAGYLKILKELLGDISFKQVLAIGGGARSTVFNKIKSSVLNIPYTTLKKCDSATFGSAVVAGYGVKIYNDFNTVIKKQVVREKTIFPDKDDHKRYIGVSGVYQGLFDVFGDNFRKLDETRWIV